VAAKKKAASGGNSRFIAMLAVVAVVGGGAIAWVVSGSGTKSVALDPNAPPPRPAGYVVGSPDAPVEIIEFADFECPGCGHFATVTEPDVMQRLVASGRARFRFVDFPLSIHPNAIAAHNAGACANEQGKFWEMHDRIFYGQVEWNTQATSNPGRVLKRYASDLGLDTKAFNACFDSRRYQTQIEANRLEGERLRVPGTPTFIIGNRLVYQGGNSYDVLQAYVDSAAADVAAGVAQRAFGGDSAGR
jgi:protein-disulfide isomerase